MFNLCIFGEVGSADLVLPYKKFLNIYDELDMIADGTLEPDSNPIYAIVGKRKWQQKDTGLDVINDEDIRVKALKNGQLCYLVKEGDKEIECEEVVDIKEDLRQLPNVLYYFVDGIKDKFDCKDVFAKEFNSWIEGLTVEDARPICNDIIKSLVKVWTNSYPQSTVIAENKKKRQDA